MFHFLFPLALVDNSDPLKLYLLLKEVACHCLPTGRLAECGYSYLADKSSDFQTRQFLSGYLNLTENCAIAVAVFSIAPGIYVRAYFNIKIHLRIGNSSNI